jgi:hypothetical protein
MCALLVGLPGVHVAGVGQWPHWLLIVITTLAARPPLRVWGAAAPSRCA